METYLPFATAFVGYLLGFATPVLKWAVEKRRLRMQARRETVRSWREMVLKVRADYLDWRTRDEAMPPLAELLEKHPEFYSLKPQLSDKILRKLPRNPFSAVVHRSPESSDPYLDHLVDEIGRIERKWGLL